MVFLMKMSATLFALGIVVTDDTIRKSIFPNKKISIELFLETDLKSVMMMIINRPQTLDSYQGV